MKLRPHRVKTDFALRVNNKGYTASLDTRKIYQVIPDSGAVTYWQIRVTDESSEHYLYPEDFFIPVELLKAVEKCFALAIWIENECPWPGNVIGQDWKVLFMWEFRKFYFAIINRE